MTSTSCGDGDSDAVDDDNLVDVGDDTDELDFGVSDIVQANSRVKLEVEVEVG